MINHRQIYKTDSAGKTRVWNQQQDGAKYRTVAGIEDGNLVESGWTTCTGKQGRSDIEQATSEIESAYKHKLTREYHETKETTSAGAHFFKPMLAHKYETFAPGYAQPKLDGVRCIATKDGLFSREGKPIPGAPHIFEALKEIFRTDPNTILDGELYNHLLKDDFNTIVSLVKKANPDPARAAKIRELVQYHVYDMPSHPGNFGLRMASIRILLSTLDGDFIIPVETDRILDVEMLNLLYGRWLEQGYEGQMVRLDTPYEQKRSKSLLKRKEFQDAEFDIVPDGIQQGKGNWAGAAIYVVCWLPGANRSNGPTQETTFEAGLRGTYEANAKLLTDAENQKVVTIRFFGFTSSTIPKPRFGIATKFHGAERTL